MRVVQFFRLKLLMSLLVFGFLLLPGSPIQAQDNAVTQQQQDFQDIVGSGETGSGAKGLIFANICEYPAPTDGRADTCACRGTGNCSLDDILQLFVNITVLILGISGSLILLMFVYGGFLWVTSRGDAKRIEKGKDTITQAVIGFAIILLSYSIVNFVIAALAGDAPGATLEDTIQNAQDNSANLPTTQP